MFIRKMESLAKHAAPPVVETTGYADLAQNGPGDGALDDELFNLLQEHRL